MDSSDQSGNESDAPEVLCIPECDDTLKPKIGLSFLTIDQGVAFYHAYGAAYGFGARKSTLKRLKGDSVRLSYVLCRRAGKKNFVSDEATDSGVPSKQKRRTSSCRIECKALIGLRYKAGIGYTIYKFEEAHNHEMVTNGYRRLIKANNKVDYGHHMILGRCAKANVGASRAFHIFKQMVGRYEHVGVRKNDFKNMYRDIKSKTVGVDSEMLLERFRRFSEKNIGFFYAYFEDEDKDLSRLFWADAAAVQNFKIFGDAVSFDATYSTNKYCMVFTPFTGKDNHGRCVNFGAGLLSHENADSYSWLLSKFVECMGSAPKMLITDQDRGIKAVVESVLPDTRHRFCMWHIMTKLGDKVPRALRMNDDFIHPFTDLIWSDLYGPSEFELKWHSIMEQFDLVGHKWFDSMYEMRTSWIPAYFQDVEMSGLFRTTSLSESENSFFRRYMNKHANLCELYMHFELAIETQRDDHDRRSLANQTTSPSMITKLPIEKFAATVYTNDVFLDVQKEIEMAIMFCTVQNKVESCELVNYDVDEDAIGLFIVGYSVENKFMTCSCKFFSMQGLVCKHMFAVMRYRKDHTLLDRYIVQRWTKKACAIFENVGQNVYAAGGVAQTSDADGMFPLACKCVGLAAGNDEISSELKTLLNDFYDKNVDMVAPVSSAAGKLRVVEQYYGSSIPKEGQVGQPKISKTKGSCSRLISRKEAAVKRANKPERLCRKCWTWGHHDSRNCGKKSKN